MEWIVRDGAVLGVKGAPASLHIPEGVEEIVAGCLRGNPQVREVFLPATVKKVGSVAFRNCRSLERVSFPEGLESIGARAFEDCSALGEVVIASSACHIGERAFAFCRTLERIRLQSAPDAVADNAFYGCSAVRSFFIASRQATEHERVRLGIPDAAGFLVEGSLLKAYFGTNPEIAIPSNVEEIGPKAFKNHYELRNVEFPPNLRRIGHSAFDGCRSLQRAILPAHVEEIGANAFRQCQALTEVAIPESCRMGSGVFYGCRNIRTLRIPDGDLVTYGIPDENGFLVQEGTLLNYWGDPEYIDVPEGVKYVAPRAFNRAFSMFDPLHDLAHVHLPESMESLDFFPILRGGGITVSRPASYLKTTRPLPERSTLQWLQSKWLDVTMDEWAALFLFQQSGLRRHAAAKLAEFPQSAARELLRILETVPPQREQLQAVYGFFSSCFDQMKTKDVLRLMELCRQQGMTDKQTDASVAVSCYGIRALQDMGRRMGSAEGSEATGEGAEQLQALDRALDHLTKRMSLSGMALSTSEWKAAFLDTPILSKLSGGIVWKQGTQAFILKDGMPTSLSGNVVSLHPDKPIGVMHALHFDDTEALRWRQLFARVGIQSRGGQINEPRYQEIHPDRFLGCRIPICDLLGLEADGISLYHLDHNEVGFETIGSFRLGFKLELPYGKVVEGTDPLILGMVDVPQMDAQVNHLLYVFDLLTLHERLGRDDPTLMPLLSGAPAEMVTKWLQEAMEQNAVHAIAALLRAKRQLGLDMQGISLE